MPQFNRTSYIAYNTLSDALQEVQISMMLRPLDLRDAILLYNGQGGDGYGDFIAITIKDEHVEFRYDSGSGLYTVILCICHSSHVRWLSE